MKIQIEIDAEFASPEEQKVQVDQIYFQMEVFTRYARKNNPDNKMVYAVLIDGKVEPMPDTVKEAIEHIGIGSLPGGKGNEVS